MSEERSLHALTEEDRGVPVGERAARGRTARSAVPRSAHGNWTPTNRADPLAILRAQETQRVPELVPIRHGRMASSPFAFFRGAAAVMAADLALQPSSGLQVQLCGDAHLLNFGGFADPSRQLVFDVNDFDETNPGPFEWDVKRLAASLEIAGRERGFDEPLRRQLVVQAGGAYRRAIHEFASMRVLDVWYSRLDVPGIERRWGSKATQALMRNLRRAAAKAPAKDNLRAFAKLTIAGDGAGGFRRDPPLLEPITDLFRDIEVERIYGAIMGALARYRDALSPSVQVLLDRFRVVDVARKVVGVGSVGTRCWVALLVGGSIADPLFLQVKEAEPSVLEASTEQSKYPNHGQRVVEGQRLMQAAGDILLGWTRQEGPDGIERDFYMRQLWDWKVSAEVSTMLPEGIAIYGEMCAWTLARAHARSGDPVAIAGYLGSSRRFEDALARFAASYADTNQADFEALTRAIRDGAIEARPGI